MLRPACHSTAFQGRINDLRNTLHLIMNKKVPTVKGENLKILIRMLLPRFRIL
jgi:hypothetical protein